ncbi:MFS transporter [Paenibacillus sepulcri]|uniref:MFS transporter n=1 Tax=Paenibacillus sepulcri TaxID=359917 RepID=UPI001AEB61EA
MHGSRLWTKNFIAICFSSFFIYITVYMLNTTLPTFVKEVLHGNQQQMGLVITLWSVGVIAFRLFSGRWIEMIGLKKTAIISFLLFFLAVAIYLGAYGILFLLIVRLIHGGSFAVAATATSTLAADLIPDSQKGEGIGYFSMFMSIAMVIGPAIGAYVIHGYDNSQALFIVSLILSGLSLICLVFVRHSQQTSVRLITNEKKSWRNLIERKVLPISFVGFLLSFSYSSLTSFIFSYTMEMNLSRFSGLFFVIFALIIIVSRPLVGIALDKWREHFIVYPGTIIFVIGVILLSKSETGFLLLLSAAIIGFGYGALFPCFQLLAIQAVALERRNIAISTFFLFFDLGFGIGSFVLGWIASKTSYQSMYLVAAIAGLACSAVYFAVHHPFLKRDK